MPRLSNRIRRENDARRREEARERRLLPEVLEMRHPAHHEHQVERAVADHLIGDVDVAAPRVVGFRAERDASRVWRSVGGGNAVTLDTPVASARPSGSGASTVTGAMNR